jgi:S1-C subfamily serine protease
MPEQLESGLPRICPSCERRVPPRVGECRCGYEFPVPTVEVTASAEFDEPDPQRSWATPALVGVLVVCAATVYFIQSGPTKEPVGVGVAAAASRAPVQPAPPAADVAVAITRAAAPLAAPAVPLPAAAPVPAAPLLPGALSFEEIVGSAGAAVVSIETSTSRGSGFFVTPELIVTNAHVVQHHGVVTVKLSDGRSIPARVQRSSPLVDIAIVRPDAPQAGQRSLPMGSVNAARPGQEVIAIGSALGVLQNTVTRGIVSAVRNANGVMLIQTDAAINPGNSGGPLIDRSGRVIGITTLKVAANSESLGFAVAIDHATPLLEGRQAELIGAPPGSPAAPGLAGAFRSDRSQSDADRDQGAAFYDRAMQSLSRRADSIDDYWNRFRVTCRPAGPSTSGGRGWFAVWERTPVMDSSDTRCVQWLNEITQVAGGMRASMSSTDETARAAGVYPGVRRELRKKYGLDWDGWDR